MKLYAFALSVLTFAMGVSDPLMEIDTFHDHDGDVAVEYAPLRQLSLGDFVDAAKDMACAKVSTCKNCLRLKCHFVTFNETAVTTLFTYVDKVLSWSWVPSDIKLIGKLADYTSLRETSSMCLDNITWIEKMQDYPIIGSYISGYVEEVDSCGVFPAILVSPVLLLIAIYSLHY
eukprot:Blabericola_migrator_1__5564@NODE_2833_length_2301_cov_373_338406_g1778_i0_p1_GENE_NODE_2833_length_2301_cov_373_338406_g1778_i0NODE_2833_length_2301_cov_373_338406_g1778_i0_p1_ORF_typecomplete_len174_score31_09Proton_antipo_N/PF00662_20/0_15_NODE_2833_length_2301_cov_373_338406_g1778_i014561977